MARKKTRLVYIANDAARRITLRKRRIGLLKKVYELSVLCNIPACAVIYSPQETEPEIWPSRAEATDLLNRFNAAEGFSKENNMMNQEKFLCKEIVKLRGQLGRIMAENDELEGDVFLLEFLAGRLVSGFESYRELGLLGSAIARRIEAVQARLLGLKNNGVESQSLPMLLPPPTMEETMAGGVDSGTEGLLAWEQGLFPGFEKFF